MIREHYGKKASEDSKIGEEVHLIEYNSNREMRATKVASNTKLQIVSDANATLFCISVDGSSHSDTAFNIVSEEFLKLSSSMLVVHIYNEKYNEHFNWRNKKETIVENYGSKLSRFSTSKFMIEDKTKDCVHVMEQVHNFALHFKAQFLVSGYYGIKGPKGDNAELSKGVHYLLGNSKINTIMIKDTGLRSTKKQKGYNWLVVMDKKYSRPVKCLHAFSQLINPENDFVYGLTLKEFNQNDGDDVKELFMEEVKAKGLKNYSYEFMCYDKVASKVVTEKVNFADIGFDFLVMYNNRDKYLNEGQESDIVNIVKNCLCTICIFNF